MRLKSYLQNLKNKSYSPVSPFQSLFRPTTMALQSPPGHPRSRSCHTYAPPTGSGTPSRLRIRTPSCGELARSWGRWGESCRAMRIGWLGSGSRPKTSGPIRAELLVLRTASLLESSLGLTQPYYSLLSSTKTEKWTAVTDM